MQRLHDLVILNAHVNMWSVRQGGSGKDWETSQGENVIQGVIEVNMEGTKTRSNG